MHIYADLARHCPDPVLKEKLNQFAMDEKRHREMANHILRLLTDRSKKL